MILEEFLQTAFLYQATNTRNINALAVLKQYLVFVTKEQWGDFCTVGFCERVIRLSSKVTSND